MTLLHELHLLERECEGMERPRETAEMNGLDIYNCTKNPFKLKSTFVPMTSKDSIDVFTDLAVKDLQVLSIEHFFVWE